MVAASKKIKNKSIKKNQYFYWQIENFINNQLTKLFKTKITVELTEPPQHINFDLTFNTYNLAKTLKKNPEEIAIDIKNHFLKIQQNYFQNIEQIGSFINFKINFNQKTKNILKEITEYKNKYGEIDLNKNKVCVIEYSSPNIAKPIGVGHLRSTIIGQALANLYQATGYKVIKLNYLGDWGTQFGQLIYAYLKWGDDKKILKNPTEELKNLYVKFNQEKEKNPALEEEARKYFNLLEKGDKKLLNLWQKFKKLSIKDFKKTYELLNIKFDIFSGESFYVKESQKLIEVCLKKKIAQQENDNSIIVKINNLPTFILKKSDGSTVYLSRDLAALKDRIKKFKPKTMLYVVGQEQELHFKQLFKLAQLLKIYDPKKINIKHISFGLVLKEGKKMSTRLNRFVSLKELINKIIILAKQALKNKNLKEKEISKISKIIAIGAIIYNDLKQSKEKNISFDWEKMLNFKEGTAVYLQYTTTRITSILKKIKNKNISLKNLKEIKIENPLEQKILQKLVLYPKIILKAQNEDAPHLIIEYLQDLAKIFNTYYESTSIINTKDKNELNFKIYLIKSVKQIITNGLNLLNIQIPSKM